MKSEANFSFNIKEVLEMLSTYINELLAAGFILERLAEPTLPSGNYAHWSEQALAILPRALIVSAKKTG